MSGITKELVACFLKVHKEEFRERYGVSKIGLFGSLVRDELTDDSDIDVAIEMVQGQKNLHNFLEFKRRLEKEFGMPVDLGIESNLKTEIRDRVGKEFFYV